MDDEGQRILNDIRFYSQIFEDAKRTLYCPPSQADAVRNIVDEHELGHLYTVSASPVVPAGRIIMVDEQALDAATQQAAQRPIRFGGGSRY
ncbi:hypothetical protein ABZ508_33225 [Streptomyces lavendulocolor]|uniref:Uncharacterized protein n=1 Tax=Streptomyces lavendulocolor TaxID=67316 RepID=A0ABV2WFT5_9ACTN